MILYKVYNAMLNDAPINKVGSMSSEMEVSANLMATTAAIALDNSPATIKPAFTFMFIFSLSEVLLLIYYYKYNYRRNGITGQLFLTTKKPVVFTQQAQFVSKY